MLHIDLELPFDIDQRVYPIYLIYPDGSEQKREIVCPFCEGDGDIGGRDGTRASCPRCLRQGTVVDENPWVWEVDGLGETVLSLDHYKLDMSEGGEITIEAMIYDAEALDCIDDWTPVTDIFVTQHEAQAECDRRNGVH